MANYLISLEICDAVANWTLSVGGTFYSRQFAMDAEAFPACFVNDEMHQNCEEGLLE